MLFLEIQVLWVWDIRMCHWAHGSVCYEEMYCLHLRWFSWLLDPEDEGTTFLWNVRNHPPNNVSHSWRPESSGRSEDDNLLIHNATPSDNFATPSVTQCHTFWYTMPHLPITMPHLPLHDTCTLNYRLVFSYVLHGKAGKVQPPFKKSSDKIPH